MVMKEGSWLLDVELRKRHSENLKAQRYNTTRMRYILNRRLKEYNKALKLRLEKIIDALLRQKKRIRVLDAGAGIGNFISDLNKKYNIEKKRLFFDAMSLYDEKSPLESTKYIDNVYNVSAEDFDIEEKYDLIVSVYGATYHSIFYTRAVNRLAYALKPGGIAVLHYYSYDLEKGIYGDYNGRRSLSSLTVVLPKLRRGRREYMRFYQNKYINSLFDLPEEEFKVIFAPHNIFGFGEENGTIIIHRREKH